jgi:hypothetical protein
MTAETGAGSAPAGDNKKRRRRRRRRGGPKREGAERQDASNGDEGGKPVGRRGKHADGSPSVNTPNSSRNLRKRRKRRRRAAPIAGLNRRRRASRHELQELEAYFKRVPVPLMAALYKGMGGQPSRVTDGDRMVQLLVRALAQGKRMSSLLRGLHEKERTALAVLIQCGGLAHSEEFLRELHLSLGGGDREWTKVMVTLADRGLLFASEEQDGQFFYMVPEPLVEFLVEHLADLLAVGIFKNEDIQVRNARPFCPPFDFSVTTLCTYIDQRPPRLTQQHEIFKAHKQELDEFFAQLWDVDSELFHFHLDFLVAHGLVELRGDRLGVNREVVEEWLQMDAQDQRDLVFRALDLRFRYAEWVLHAVHAGKGEWVPERPLQALYRRWMRGEDWRKRFQKGEFAATRTNERESFSFAPLVNCGILELGEWGQEKFYRLTPRAQALLEPPEGEGFSQFYLTPSYEIMAPAGLPPLLLFYVGELAELVGCDRANTYKITEVSIEQALNKGWKRDNVVDFLRDSSQIGLPENVEQMLKDWMGQGNDVEFHDCMLVSVHKSRIRAVESSRELKPFLLHRFVPGLYAIDRTRLAEVYAVLAELGVTPAKDINRYPGEVEQTGARRRLHELLAEARDESSDPQRRAHEADTQPETLHSVPGSGAAKARRKKPSKKKKAAEAPRATPTEARQALDRAIALKSAVEVQYATKDGSRVKYTLKPQRLALNPRGDQVVVAINLATDELRTFKVRRIERIKSA